MKIKKAVILAAGQGMRMLPATKTIPKEMLTVVDKPAIQYIVEEVAAAGIEDILIVTNRAKSAMEDYFDYHPELEEKLARAGKTDELAKITAPAELANICYLRQKITKGMGHAVWMAKSFVGSEPFAVLSGDDIIVAERPVIGQLIDVAEEHNAACVGVQRVDRSDIGRYCTLQVEAISDRTYEVKRLIEKPEPEEILSDFAILGRYILTADLFDILETIPPGHGGEIQLTDAVNALCRRRRVLACDYIGKRYDIGNLTGYIETIVDFALRHPESGGPMRQYIKEKARETE